LRALDPQLQIKSFTAIEVRHLARRIFKTSIAETLDLLREAGLNSLTGGGAEIFDPGVRDELCRGKETAAEWLDVHRTWHQMGGRSTCTMLFGHIETDEQRVDHLRQLRELQDETHGFTGFIPFAFEPGEGTVLAHIPRATAFEQLRNLAVSRIYLDNIDHLTAYWVSMGLPLAQVALSYGVDDLHGTIMREKIFHMAGVTTPEEQTVETLRHIIREAGRDPVQRDSYYNHLRRATGRRVGRRRPILSAPNELPPVRIGCVGYLNARPLITAGRVEVRFDHPAALCQQLAAGELDVALVSSFEYLRHPIYSIVDGVAIASNGPVYSVILAHLGRNRSAA
jgi:CofH subfamily radical SAM domain protein